MGLYPMFVGNESPGAPLPDPPALVPSMPAQALLAYGGRPEDAITNVTTLAGLPFAAVAPQYNLLLLTNYLGVEGYGTWPSVIRGWKNTSAANGTGLKFFFYTNGMGPPYSASGYTYKWFSQALTAASMWAYTSLSGSGTTDILEYSGYPGFGWLQISPYNAQVMPSGTINGKTNVLEGADLWTLDTTYWTDVLINGLASSKYGEAAANVPNSYVDGIYFDNCSPNLQAISSGGSGQTGVPANWLGFTNPLQGWDAAADAAVQAGQAQLVASLKGINPNLISMANSAGGLQGTVGNPNPGGLDYEIYHSPGWDLAHAQYVFGVSYSMETYNNSPPGHWMQCLSYALNLTIPGGSIVMEAGGYPGGVAGNVSIAQAAWAAPDWSALRMMVCAAIVGGFYFALDGPASNPGDALLWDEMRQAAGANAIAFNWLGADIDPPQTSAWQTFTSSIDTSVAVWRRRFNNGTVFWIPRQANGNGNLDPAQTVTVTGAGTGLSYCDSQTPVGAMMPYGDTTVNTGAPISSANGGTVTLINDGYGAGLVLRNTPT